MSRFLVLASCGLIAFAQQALPDLVTGFEFATVETTADASVHAGKLNGTGEVLTLAGPEDTILIRFRVGLIEKWTIEKAILAFHTPAEFDDQQTLAVSAVQAGWNEGSVSGPEIPAGVVSPTRQLKSGWVAVEIPPELARQLASGKSSSVALSKTGAGQISIHSRRTGQFMPYLLVRGHGPLLRYP